jgi:hypothetical protein
MAFSAAGRISGDDDESPTAAVWALPHLFHFLERHRFCFALKSTIAAQSRTRSIAATKAPRERIPAVPRIVSAEDEHLFALGSFRTLAERKKSGHAGVRKRRRVMESIRHREAKRRRNHSTLCHRAVRTARPAKENPGAIGKVANTIRSADHRQFTWTGERSAGGKLLVNGLERCRAHLHDSFFVTCRARGSSRSGEACLTRATRQLAWILVCL